MDAQNAAESSSTKQLASPKEGDSGADVPKSKPTSATATNTLKSPTNNKFASLAKDSRPGTISSSTLDEDAALDQNSDAETIVLPGKDNISPSKPRKAIKHEDKSDEEINSIPRPRKPLKDTRDVDRNSGHSDDATSILIGGRKKHHVEKEKQRAKDISGALGSAPNSPLVHNITNNESSHRRRKSGDVPSESGSESSKSRSHKVSHKDEVKSVERLLPGKRKPVKTESDDDGEMRKARRQRISDTSIDASAGVRDRDHRTSSGRHVDKQYPPRNRSASPPSRIHRRSISTQLPSQFSNGLSNKKRRIPAPLQSTEYQSDDSSASGSPHPRSSKIKSIVTPITGESTISPARMPGHKKHVDNHGQTLFAKACAKGEYDMVKKRLAERPEDLNFADYAGNTPLQVASLNGRENIVQLLIEAGCNLDCRNSDKETPLLDAVENGHLGVVKLLLKAGVNPRKADAEGHEPLEKVPDDLDNAEEIRAALREAKERVGELRRTSEDHQPQDLHDTLSSHGPDSPRDSSVTAIGSLLAEKRRGGTVRSTKTSNHLLYMNLDDKTLRQAAARGDNETVTRVLQVKERCDDPEALVNAARGGHNLVVELLLALGSANPDPRPVPGLPIEHGTPMLAAIGQENIEVIKLLLNANGFNPTRQYKGQAYYEIARRREGPNWKEEEHILKEAYDQFKKGSKGSKTKPSPSRRERELDADSRRGNRTEPTPDVSRPQKRRTSISPSRELEPKKKLNAARVPRSPREKRRSLSFGTQDEQISPKRGPGRPKRDERGSNTASSDREISPARSKNPAMPKLIEPDVAGSSDGEAIKPRRKLISGKDLKGQREKQRRESLVSNVSGIDRGESKIDESSERPRGDREKHLNRTKALKREESTDRLSATDASGKRHRSSASPSRRGFGEKDDTGAPMKRRKLDFDAKERRYLEPPSPESRQRKRELSRDSTQRQRNPENDRREPPKPMKAPREHRESEKPSNSDKSITVASEEPDVEMRDSIQVSEEEGEIQADSEKEDTKKQRKRTPLEPSVYEEVRRRDAERELQERARKKQEEEVKRKEQEAERKRLEAEERSRLEELKRKELAEKARLEAEQKLREEEERKRQEEQERKQREEQERLQREQQERRQREEQERKQREEQERRQREEQERRQREEQERRQREEQERRQREEEERIRREKEAAAAEEEARRLREEEERQEREREQAERAARELELQLELQRAQQAEQERIRVSKLPPLLRWLDGCPNPKQSEIAELFVKTQGVRYDTIDPSATGKPGGRDQWLLSTQVALLLGEKDLSLSDYPSWERVPVSNIAKRVIWRLEQDRYALTSSKLYHLGEQLPDLYGGDPRTVGYKKLEQIRGEAANRFLETDMFFVKETDFLHIVPSIPHLRDLRISICYRELPESETVLFTFSGPSKWKHDPDAASRGSFAPRNKYYTNGRLIGEEKPGTYRPSREPFPEHRVPRRHGLVKVTPDEPDYARLCVEQNLAYLLTEQQKQSVLNGSHLTPKSMASNETTEYVGDNVSPTDVSPQTYLVNGFRRNLETLGRLPNGISGTHYDEHH